uniref:NADH dehydrogenase subunit 5 n=1 Tax=Araniella displicata TaxID=336630 RepID=UPI00207985D3|nr:NADH dehydrogenase subunit 5 [Araniella displicata]URW97647.1 NADH dehydrogenase subunit 5 [Araniella displicata]
MFFQSVLMLMFSIPMLFLSIYMLFSHTFISMELYINFMMVLNIPISVMLDWTSMMFLFIVMFISSMILLFSVEYIPQKEHKQFSMMLLAFVLSMSFLIMSDNIIFMLLGWDGLGLTSFILVVYYQNSSSSASGAITIFSNRVGDILILLSIALLLSNCNWNFYFNENFPKLGMIFLMLAACSKSAQFPFSAWLPAAMAAPTPISALVHSSTLVTAGVYMLIRIMNFPHPTTMLLILIISSMTALYASMSANWEMDMKKIIALSTLSQIAMMMFAISLGAVTLAFFHLVIHAIFKSLMFLCAGTIIHSSSYQDSRNMGTMLSSYPIVSTVLGISALSLMGVPFMSGFFSKDPIIETVIYSKIFSLMSFLMILSVGMTSTYSIRMITLAMKFYNKSKPDINLHPSNFMEAPIIMMAPFSVILGTLMVWIFPLEPSFFMPLYLKMSIIFCLLIGILLGTYFNYSAKKYKNLGQASISLWFSHFITTMPFLNLSNLMNSFLKNDKYWQEMYGPKYCFKSTTIMSSYPDSYSAQLLFVILMMTLYPLLILNF